MHNALLVANEIISKAKERNISLTLQKLQKLVFFSNAWHLEIFDEELVNDSFKATEFGPIMPIVKSSFREFGSNEVSEIPLLCMTKLSDEQKNLITEVVDIYAPLEGAQLLALATQPDSAWAKIWRHGIGVYNAIPSNMIKEEQHSLRQKVEIAA